MRRNEEKKPKNKKQWIYLISLLLLLILLVGVAIVYIHNKDEKDENTLAYTDLIKELAQGKIEKIEMTVGSTTVKVKQKEVEEEKKSIVPNTESFIRTSARKSSRRKSN